MIEQKHKANKLVVILLLVLFFTIMFSFYKYKELQNIYQSDNSKELIRKELEKTKIELQKEQESNKILSSKLKDLSHLEKIQKDVARAWDKGKN